MTSARVAPYKALALLVTLALVWPMPVFAVSSRGPRRVPPLEHAIDETVNPETLLFFNARVSTRESRPQDTLKLWLLRNALVTAGAAPQHDGDFHSLVWVALGDAGLCPEGFPLDDEGAGLWPLAFHNWLLKASARRSAKTPPAPFPAFRAGLQQRHFSLIDTLSHEEIQTVKFFKSRCFAQYTMAPHFRTTHITDTTDRLSTGLMMRDAIVHAFDTLNRDKVQHLAVLETRLFDLDVALSKLAHARAKREGSILQRIAQRAGVSEAGGQVARQRRLDAEQRSNHVAFLRRALLWNSAGWLSLSSNRRLALFQELLDENVGSPAELRRVAHAMIDAMLRDKQGTELNAWLGYLADDHLADPVKRVANEALPPTPTAAFALSERGAQALTLTPDTGFRERAAIALWRGVAAQKSGDTAEALKTFAYALSVTDSSRDGDTIHMLTKRWLAFVLAQYESTDAVLEVLNRFLPPHDFNEVVESLWWRAAFHGDAASFERIEQALAKRGARGANTLSLQLLKPLAQSNLPAFFQGVDKAFADEKAPGVIANATPFYLRVVQELMVEPLDVRFHQRELLRTIKKRLDVLALQQQDGIGRDKRRVKATQLAQTLLDGVDAFDDSVRGRIEALAPDAESYAGSVRLAPKDPLPWPFAKPQPVAPNAFSPLHLVPTEWRDPSGRLVMGFRITE